MWPHKSKVGLAVSGGPDSLALLLLAHETMPRRFAVATVDHGLRAESASEARAVVDICAARDIPHRTITLALAGGSGVQARARAARYAAMGDWLGAEGLGALVSAHHLDDQAETLVMRLNRGAGVRGLAGMRAVGTVPGHPALPLLRPLLGWRRAELVGVVTASGLIAADDPSNRDEAYERVRVRSALAAFDLLDPVALSASASHLADADEALEWAAAQAWDRAEKFAARIVWQPLAPRAVRLRVLERIVAEMGHGIPRGAELARWHDALDAGEVATLAGVRGEGRASEWRFTPAPPHRNMR